MSNILFPANSSDLVHDWENGWKRLYDKAIQKKGSPERALHESAKDYVRINKSTASQYMSELLENVFELNRYKTFCIIIGKTLGTDETKNHLAAQIIEKLNGVQKEVSDILDSSPLEHKNLTENKEITSKEAFITFWFDTLEKEVIDFAGEHGLHKSILLACRNHPETQKIGHGLYAGIPSNLTKFAHILKVLLEIHSPKIEDLLSTIYKGKRIPEELKLKNSPKNFRIYPEKSSV